MNIAYLSLIFPILMVVAAVGDVFTMRISNKLNIAIGISFVFAAIIIGMPTEIAMWHIIACLVLLAAGILLFLTNKFGGGDAKLMAVGALWIGWSALPAFLVCTAMAGGVLAIMMILYKPLRTESEMRGLTWFNRLFPGKAELPYGVAIAAGALLTFPETWWVKSGMISLPF